MESFVFPAHPVSVALSRVGTGVSNFTRLAGVRNDLMDHKRVLREIGSLRAELTAFEAVVTADAEKQRLEIAAKRRADKAYARQLEAYLVRHPLERERAIRLGMKEAAHAAYVADGLAEETPLSGGTISVLVRKPVKAAKTPLFQLGRRKAA